MRKKIHEGFAFFTNVVVALGMGVMSLPLLCFIALLIKMQRDGPVFYKGARLGQGKQLFDIYKFRTLVPRAQEILGAQLVSQSVENHKLETPFGKFLRETRLDELPQLFNVLKGDMRLVGPRPERPEIYEKICKEIQGYDHRFRVKPGVIGPSQLFTPHGAPKRLRTYIDNRYAKSESSISRDLLLTGYAIGVLTRKALRKSFKFAWQIVIKSKVLKLFEVRRMLERVDLKDAKAYMGLIHEGQYGYRFESKLVNINEEALLLYSQHYFDAPVFLLQLEIPDGVRMDHHAKKHYAHCIGKIFKRLKIEEEVYKYKYVIKYQSASPLDHYMIQQYFLEKSIALPHAPVFFVNNYARLWGGLWKL